MRTCSQSHKVFTTTTISWRSMGESISCLMRLSRIEKVSEDYRHRKHAFWSMPIEWRLERFVNDSKRKIRLYVSSFFFVFRHQNACLRCHEGSGTVGRAVASDTRGPQFEYSHFQFWPKNIQHNRRISKWHIFNYRMQLKVLSYHDSYFGYKASNKISL